MSFRQRVDLDVEERYPLVSRKERGMDPSETLFLTVGTILQGSLHRLWIHHPRIGTVSPDPINRIVSVTSRPDYRTSKPLRTPESDLGNHETLQRYRTNGEIRTKEITAVGNIGPLR